MFLRKQRKMKHILANMMMAIVLIACSNGGMDPVDNGGEDEYVPVRVETVEDNGVETRAVALSNASIGIFRTAPYTATFPQQYDGVWQINYMLAVRTPLCMSIIRMVRSLLMVIIVRLLL